MTESHYMFRAVSLASRGGGWVNPNPQVGAVVVKDGRIIAEGYHARYGEAHAERVALESVRGRVSLEGAVLYVTLEPCCHTGKTPPCTEVIITSGITRVVIGSDDPNPHVHGGGIEQLRRAGIEVVTGFMKEECDQLNRIFFHYIQKGTPYVLAKYAMTLDGKIATRTGASKWITGEESRHDAHLLRSRYAAIMVGIKTVLADDPLLTCRIKGGHNPLRVVCDSKLSIPLGSQIVQTAHEVPTLLATTVDEKAKRHRLEDLGCTVVVHPSKEGRLDLELLLRDLAQREIDSVLLEGGSTLLGAAFEAGVVQAVRCYIAPRIFGGADAPSPVGGEGVSLPSESFKLVRTSVTSFGEDICIEGEVE